jgi:hypothetical protein
VPIDAVPVHNWKNNQEHELKLFLQLADGGRADRCGAGTHPEE